MKDLRELNRVYAPDFAFQDFLIILHAEILGCLLPPNSNNCDGSVITRRSVQCVDSDFGGPGTISPRSINNEGYQTAILGQLPHEPLSPENWIDNLNIPQTTHFDVFWELVSRVKHLDPQEIADTSYLAAFGLDRVRTWRSIEGLPRKDVLLARAPIRAWDSHILYALCQQAPFSRLLNDESCLAVLAAEILGCVQVIAPSSLKDVGNRLLLCDESGHSVNAKELATVIKYCSFVGGEFPALMALYRHGVEYLDIGHFGWNNDIKFAMDLNNVSSGAAVVLQLVERASRLTPEEIHRAGSSFGARSLQKAQAEMGGFVWRNGQLVRVATDIKVTNPSNPHVQNSEEGPVSLFKTAAMDVLSSIQEGGEIGTSKLLAKMLTKKLKSKAGDHWPVFFQTPLGRHLEAPAAVLIVIATTTAYTAVRQGHDDAKAAQTLRAVGLKALTGLSADLSEMAVEYVLPTILSTQREIMDEMKAMKERGELA